jgi:hypothetical protein
MTAAGKKALRLLCVACLLGLFAFLAWRRSPWLQEIPWLPRWLGQWADRHGDLRNLPAFAGLGLGLIFALGFRPGLLAGLGVAIVLEVVQLWIPGRYFSWMDIVASCLGVLAAAGFVAISKGFRAKQGDAETME